jgi:hypothetical protein
VEKASGYDATTWKVAFGHPPSKDEASHVDTGRPIDEAQISAIRNQLAALYRSGSILYQLHRARAGMKSTYLLLLVPVLTLLLMAFATAVAAAGASWSSIGLALAAGASGASLSGTLKVRDQISSINDLRAFTPSVVVQPLIGATAGTADARRVGEQAGGRSVGWTRLGNRDARGVRGRFLGAIFPWHSGQGCSNRGDSNSLLSLVRWSAVS